MIKLTLKHTHDSVYVNPAFITSFWDTPACTKVFVGGSSQSQFFEIEESAFVINQMIQENNGIQIRRSRRVSRLYVGEDNPYEAIKVIEAWDLGFCLGNCVKYIARAGKKTLGRRGSIKDLTIEDLKKARWYLEREISRLES